MSIKQCVGAALIALCKYPCRAWVRVWKNPWEEVGESTNWNSLPMVGYLLTSKRAPCNEGHMGGKERAAKPSKGEQRKCHLLAIGVTVARDGTWRWRKEWGTGISIHSTNLSHLPFIILMWLARRPLPTWCDRWRWHINLHPFRPPMMMIIIIIIIILWLYSPSCTCHPVSCGEFWA